MNCTDTFLALLKDLERAELSGEVLHQIKRCLLDYVGVTYAGRKALGKKLSSMEQREHDACCSVIATEKKDSLVPAAMMNGMAAHILELDDGHRIGAPHLEAVIISVMIAIAQKERLSYERFVKGILIGYEATVRLSSAMQPGLKNRGFHATGVCGTIGAACAAGYAIKLNDEQMKGAFSAAASSAAGILKVLDDDSQLKPYNVANAIQSGITAAYLGKCGFRGPDDVLEGKRGYLQAHTDRVDYGYLLGPLDKPAIFQIYVKPYASCRHSHPAVECALKLRASHPFSVQVIEDIEVQTYLPGILAHDSTEIASVSAAKMSTPYSVAAALVLGNCGLEAFSEQAIGCPEIKELTRKIRVVENEALTKANPGKRGAIVNIRLKDGSVLTEDVDNPLGEPENGLSDAQLIEKYDSLMTFAGVKKEEADKIRTWIRNLEDSYERFIRSI